jgi:hypothetical protein
MRMNGSCHCGEITFVAAIDPDKLRICHCTDCRKLSGTAFRLVVPVDEGDFELTSGNPKIYVKLADSGNERQQAFCGTCGTPIFAASNAPGPRRLGIRAGTLDGGDRLVPLRQFWTASALPWLRGLIDMESIERQ